MRALLIASILLAAVACSDPVPPTDRLDTTAQIAAVGSDSVPPGVTTPPTIRVDGRTLLVTGIMPTPDPCNRVTGAFEAVQGEILVRLVARSSGNPCIAVLGQFAFRLTKELAPGSYTVRLIHEYPGTGWPTTEVAVQPVVVE